MRTPIPPYQEFLDWCHEQRGKMPRKVIRIAENKDESNRTGHMLRGYAAAVSFLRANPSVHQWVLKQNKDVNRPIDRSDEKFLKPWLQFLTANRARHAILRRILPSSLGGDTRTGGGGGYPFKLALRLAAEFLEDPDTPDEIAESDIPEKFRMVRRREFDRDTTIVKELKRLYEFKCQVCGSRIDLGRDRYYAEGHHLRPLGGQHHGSDDRSNIVILCPGHHTEFDFFLFAILAKKGLKRSIEHMYRDLPEGERVLTMKRNHNLDSSSIDYVEEQFLTRLETYYG